MSKSLVICEVNSICHGFSLTNWLLNQNQGRVIESSVLSKGHFLIIVEGESEQLNQLFQQAETQTSLHWKLLQEISPDLLPAFYSLQNDVPQNSSLLIVECTSVIEAFSVANASASFDRSLRLLDIRSGRGTGGVPLVFVVGPKDALQKWEKDAAFGLHIGPHRHTLILEPHPQLTELFV